MVAFDRSYSDIEEIQLFVSLWLIRTRCRKRYDGTDPHGHESHTEPSDGTYADIPAAGGDESGYMDVNVDQYYDEPL